jgi:pimeloyl-ACP methyl ester carboxylesterase
VTKFFLGESESAILCVLAPPSGALDRDHGVLICPPIGQEHVRTHWALRQAQTALCRAGFHCLRFDWFGVGDSAGDLHEATLERWRANLIAAARALRDVAGVHEVSLVGLRVGASLAALAAAPVQPSAIVLWDPVVNGRRYLADLGKLTWELATDPKRYWNLDPNRRPPDFELVGFDFGARLSAELGEVELGNGEMVPRVPLCLVRSTGDGELEVFGRQLERSHPGVVVRDTDARTSWTDPDDVERLLLPGDAIGAITAFLEAHAV